MARTIESPGVQINEIDLSFNTSLPVGTNVFVNGFASQGPTLELINITSKSELEQIYGSPTTEAERYFYQSCTEILNSPANLLCNRLPYGAGAGGGFGDNYTGLFYPVSGYEKIEVTSGDVPAVSSYQISSVSFSDSVVVISGLPEALTWDLDDITTDEYVIADENFVFTLSTDQGSWGTSGVVEFKIAYAHPTLTNVYQLTSDRSPTDDTYWDGQLNVVDGSLEFSTPGLDESSGLNVSSTYNQRVLSAETPGLTSGYIDAEYDKSSKFVIGEPVLLNLSEEEYTDIKSGQVNWTQAGSNALTYENVSASNANLGGTGFIVLNKTKLSTNDSGEGYYFGIIDSQSANNDGIPVYNSVESVQSVNQTNPLGFYSLAETSLGLPLTGTETSNQNSISEQLESGFQYDFTDASYKDSLIFGLVRLRTTNTATSDTEQLYIGYQEKFVGSLDSQDLNRTNPQTLQQESFFIEKQMNDASNYIEVVVNPYIAEEALWRTSEGRIGEVEVADNAKKVYSLGQFVSTRGVNTNKVIGQVPAKLEASFLLAENIDAVDMDITVEAGLGTIYSYSAIKDIQGGGDGTNPIDFDPYMNVNGEIEDLDDPTTTGTTGRNAKIGQYYNVINNSFSNFVSETRKDCMHISDPLRGIMIQGRDFKVIDRKDRNFSQHIYWPLKNLFGGSNNNYVATYANWVKSFDTKSGKFFWSPFSGYQAAIMARMDANSQPWFAPAGLENGIIRNILDIGINPTQKQRDMLYKIGINPVVYFPRDAYCVWGQKTLQAKPSAFDRINVRRLFLTLEKATLRLTRYFVMQPNTVFTRTRLVNYLKPIFDIAKENEGVYDYLLVCDERNNTPDVIDRNELVLDIYIKPVRTAEFILVNFIATRTGADFNELIN